MSQYNQQPDLNQMLKDLSTRLQTLEHVTQGTFTGDLVGTAASSRAGCLLCDGSAVSRTAYAALFAAIGTTYGTGDGSTTFNVPDLRGRVPLGAGTGTAAGATAHTMGSQPTSGVGGEETHTLSVSEMPAHTHTIAAHINSTAFSTGDLTRGNNVGTEAEWTSDSTGSGTAHNNMQPVSVINWFIIT